MNIFGRTNFGDGLLKIQTNELGDLSILNPLAFYKKSTKEDIKKLFLLLANISKKDNSFFRELSLSQFKEIREQQPQVLSPRKEIDSKIFDVLGLTEDERKEVYWATAELVKNRLDKARSLNNK